MKEAAEGPMRNQIHEPAPGDHAPPQEQMRASCNQHLSFLTTLLIKNFEIPGDPTRPRFWEVVFSHTGTTQLDGSTDSQEVSQGFPPGKQGQKKKKEMPFVGPSIQGPTRVGP